MFEPIVFCYDEEISPQCDLAAEAISAISERLQQIFVRDEAVNEFVQPSEQVTGSGQYFGINDRNRSEQDRICVDYKHAAGFKVMSSMQSRRTL